MPGKKTSRTRKPAVRAAARRAPAARKSAKSAQRKAKVVVLRTKTVKPAKTKSQTIPRPIAAPKPAAKALKPLKLGAAVREPIVLKPKASGPTPASHDSRPVFVAVPSKALRRPLYGDDEDEGAGSHNLLLGPRNVRPYRERKGEQYMGRDQLDHFRDILSSWKRDLMEEVDRTMTHMKDEAANPPDPNDRATLESEFALELRTRDRERKLIRKIEEALSRIEDGSYGYCIETGEPIGVKRLEARPVATLCIEAQERRERREKQYGDRDDWYR
jgi:DnaK suppressor protein